MNKYDCIPFRVSVFKDKCTPSPFVEKFPEDDGEAARAALPDHIYMDAMGFGMGNCCLQVLKKRLIVPVFVALNSDVITILSPELF